MRTSVTRGPDALDDFLVVAFLIGVYLEIAVQLSVTTPVPNVLAALAGFALLCRHPTWIEEKHIFGLAAVVLLYLVSVFLAPDIGLLKKRLTGFLQISYSLVLSYGFFVAIVRYDRDRLGRIFFFFCVFIIVGTALENYTSFRAVSDFVRQHIYSYGLYVSDARDQMLYGRVRPKLFTSEPSAVTFCLALYSLAWYLLSTWRLKLPVFLVMTAIGYFLMRGPTLLLGLILVGPCELLISASRLDASARKGYMAKLGVIGVVTILLFVLAGWAATSLYAARLKDIAAGSDPSFFYREIGPALVAFDVFRNHPLTGVGLTGEPFFGNHMSGIFLSFSGFSPDWPMEANNRTLNNYFWLHWVYLGLGFGIVMIVAMSLYLRCLGTPNIAMCWIVWAVFGQASGAYVAPKTWAVLMLAAVISILRRRWPATHHARVPAVPAPAARQHRRGAYA